MHVTCCVIQRIASQRFVCAVKEHQEQCRVQSIKEYIWKICLLQFSFYFGTADKKRLLPRAMEY